MQETLSKAESQTSPSHRCNKLFVYGIFLDEHHRRHYQMTDPHYATVADYLTVGNHIVQAVYTPHLQLALTGLLVTMPDDTALWRDLDSLEAGYDRILEETTSGDEAWMYTSRIGRSERALDKAKVHGRK